MFVCNVGVHVREHVREHDKSVEAAKESELVVRADGGRRCAAGWLGGAPGRQRPYLLRQPRRPLHAVASPQLHVSTPSFFSYRDVGTV
jgi:hypothetical protein